MNRINRYWEIKQPSLERYFTQKEFKIEKVKFGLLSNVKKYNPKAPPSKNAL